MSRSNPTVEELIEKLTLSLLPAIEENECRLESIGHGTQAQIVCSFETLMDRFRPPVRAARHVLLLPSLCVAGQQHARRAVGEEDRYRVVVGLGEEFALRRWGDDVSLHATPIHPAPGPHHLELRTFLTRAAQEGVEGERALRVAGDVDGVDLEGVEHVEEAADVVGVGVAHYVRPVVESQTRAHPAAVVGSLSQSLTLLRKGRSCYAPALS